MRAFLTILTALAACATTARQGDVDSVLDDFHLAAAEADAPRYFGHFAPDGVFLGTDATERWTVPEFRKYADPYFSKGAGWKYTPSDRHVVFSANGRLAWFDERLSNPSYGKLRGSGVLRRTASGWKILQYNLTFLIPNDKAREVVDLIR